MDLPSFQPGIPGSAVSGTMATMVEPSGLDRDTGHGPEKDHGFRKNDATNDGINMGEMEFDDGIDMDYVYIYIYIHMYIYIYMYICDIILIRYDDITLW